MADDILKLNKSEEKALKELYKQHPTPGAFVSKGEKANYKRLFNKGLVFCDIGPDASCQTRDGKDIIAFLTPYGGQVAYAILGNSGSSKLRSIQSNYKSVVGSSYFTGGSSSRLVAVRGYRGGTIHVTVQTAAGNVTKYVYKGGKYSKGGKDVNKSDLPKYVADAFDDYRAKKSSTSSSSTKKTKRGSEADLAALIGGGGKTTPRARVSDKPKTRRKRKATGRTSELRKRMEYLISSQNRSLGMDLTGDEAFILSQAYEHDNPRRSPERESKRARLDSFTTDESVNLANMGKKQREAVQSLLDMGLIELDRANERKVAKRRYSRPIPGTTVIRITPEGRLYMRDLLKSGAKIKAGSFRGRASRARRSNPEGQETVMVTQAQIRRALGTVPSSRGVKYGNCKVSHITGGMYRITGGTARERMACKVAIESA